MKVKWSDKTIGLAGDLTNYDGEGLFRIELVEDDEDNKNDNKNEVELKMRNKYNHETDEIARALFDYIGYDVESNKEQFEKIEMCLFYIKSHGECMEEYMEMYLLLDEFADVFEERKKERGER